MLAHIGERAHTKEIPDSAVFLSELTGQDTRRGLALLASRQVKATHGLVSRALFEEGSPGEYELVIDNVIITPGVTHLTYRVMR
jgi:hypothetical protein